MKLFCQQINMNVLESQVIVNFKNLMMINKEMINS